MARIQYIYTIEVSEEQVDNVKQAVESSLGQPMGSLDRQLASQIMGQVIHQVTAMAQKNIGTTVPCARIIQHCCLLRMAATGPSFGFEVKVLSDLPPSRQIVWEDPT